MQDWYDPNLEPSMTLLEWTKAVSMAALFLVFLAALVGIAALAQPVDVAAWEVVRWR